MKKAYNKPGVAITKEIGGAVITNDTRLEKVLRQYCETVQVEEGSECKNDSRHTPQP